MIKIEKTADHNYLKLIANRDILNFIRDQFKAKPKNVFFDPRFRSHQWDGFIRFIDVNGIFLKGLLVEVLRLCKNNKYTVEFDKNIIMNPIKFTRSEIDLSMKGIALYEDTQIPVIEKVLLYNSGLVKLPTSSGKSFIEIAIMNLLYLKGLKKQILIVPRATLVAQIYDDMIKHAGFIKPEEVGRVDGANREWDKPIIISTWQSLKLLIQLDPAYPKRFDVVIQDECHIASSEAKVVKAIITSFTPKYIYGFSATILDSVSSKLEYLTTVSLFGAVVVTDTITNLQEKGQIVEAEVFIKLLQHQQIVEIHDYKEYAEFIRHSEPRRNYLYRLIAEIKKTDIDNNILVLVINVDTATTIYEELLSLYGDKVHLIVGGTKVSDRIKTKAEVKENYGNIIIATEMTMGMGENIPSLTHLILYQARKSEIALIQTCGRILRLHKDKSKAKIIDFCDDLIVALESEDGTIRKKKYGVRHLKERSKTYEKYGYKDIKSEHVILPKLDTPEISGIIQAKEN
jgi:superfamily II DNA or RNA helicase